jgi:hypothetical protein
MAQHLASVADQNRVYTTGVLIENWQDGIKALPDLAGSRWGPWLNAGGVKVVNRGNLTVLVRADSGDAADDGTSDYLEPKESDVYVLQAADGTISLAYVPDEEGTSWEGFVHVMPMRGEPPEGVEPVVDDTTPVDEQGTGELEIVDLDEDF